MALVGGRYPGGDTTGNGVYVRVCVCLDVIRVSWENSSTSSISWYQVVFAVDVDWDGSSARQLCSDRGPQRVEVKEESWEWKVAKAVR